MRRDSTWVHQLTSPSTRIGRYFDGFIYLLILTSMLLVAIDTLPSAAPYQSWFDLSEYVIVAVFTFEYALRTIAQGKQYVLSFYGLVDFFAIAPFYFSLGLVDLRGIRILRALRLLRMAKLHRYGSAWRRLRAAFADIRHELAVFCGFTLALVYLASVGIYYCEHEAQPEAFASVFHAMWWAIATLTTVGYGDVYPVTAAGRVFTFVILVLGLGVVSVPSGLLASALTKQPRDTGDKDGAMSGK